MKKLIVLITLLIGNYINAQNYVVKEAVALSAYPIVLNGYNVDTPLRGQVTYFREDGYLYTKGTDGIERQVVIPVNVSSIVAGGTPNSSTFLRGDGQWVTGGLNGNDGADGADGLNGDDGLSAYQIWINEGNSGTEQDFLDSLVGATGATGADGGIGPQGPQGIQGNAGTNGTNGTNGLGWTGGSYNAGTGIVTFTSTDGLGFVTADLRGAQGIQGIQGIQGPAGNDGADGTNGTNGSNGLGWTGGSYNAGDGTVTFTSTDGLGFTTGDLRGANGTNGTDGNDGADGATGPAGQGVVTGGTTGQILAKIDNTDYNTEWIDPPSGGGVEANDLSSAVTWVNVPNANITQSAVTQHQSALTITESQISDLSHTVNTDNQDLTLTGNTLAISNDPNTDVDLSGYLDNTDTQLNQSQVVSFMNAEYPNLDTDDTDDFDGAYASLTGQPTIPTNNNQLTNGAGYITGYTETDPTVDGSETNVTAGTNVTVTGTGTSGNPYIINSTASGGGDVTKVNTPVDNELAVWTGDGTVEGDSNLTWDGTDFGLTGNLQISAAGSTFANPRRIGTTWAVSQAVYYTFGDDANGIGSAFDRGINMNSYNMILIEGKRESLGVPEFPNDTNYPNIATLIRSSVATDSPLSVRGTAGQSAAIQLWQNDAGTTLSSINSSGQFVGDGSLLTGLLQSQITDLPTITVSTTAPGSPAVGDLWIDTN